MELCVNDKVIEKPTADDIVRALDATSFPADWFITLETDAGAMLDAVARADGRFALVHEDKDIKRRAAPDVDAAALTPILVKFLKGEPAWDAGCRWSAQGPRKRFKFVPATMVTRLGKSGDAPPPWALATMIGIIAAVTLLLMLPNWVGRGVIPYSDSDFYYIGLIFLPMVALVVVAVASKLIELRQAKTWSDTTGTVVRSEIEARHHRFAGEAETVTNMPVVEYEFTAAGRKILGRRIGIGDDAGGANTEATLARYPVGAGVTVYYDRADPAYCVLERGGPQGLSTRGCLGAIAALAIVAGAIAWLILRGPDIVRARFPQAEANVVVVAFGAGLFLLVFFIAARRLSKQAMDWPWVRGRIVKSDVESFRELRDGSWTTSYRPAIEYAYQVRGRDYRGTQIKLNLTVGGGKSYAEKVTARYPVDREVEVHYEPANPANAALENPTGATWIVAALAVAAFAVAVWQLKIF